MTNPTVPCYGNNALTLGMVIPRADPRLIEVPATDADITPTDLRAIIGIAEDAVAPSNPALDVQPTYVAARQQWRIDYDQAKMAPAIWNPIVAQVAATPGAKLCCVVLWQNKPIGFIPLSYSPTRDLLAGSPTH
jgi:hypothetical protein